MARRGRKLVALELDRAEREAFERFVRRPKTAQQLATRSRVILLCAERHSNREVARGQQPCAAAFLTDRGLFP